MKLCRYSVFEKNFSAINVDGKHFHDHKIMALVPTPKRKQNINKNFVLNTITENIQSRYSVCWLIY